jgi:hypothetical protein
MDWMGPPTLRYQGNVDGPWYLSDPPFLLPGGEETEEERENNERDFANGDTA